MGRMPSLDGLRGLAIALVVLCHLGLAEFAAVPGLNFKGSGFYGVSLFFTLSAYLLTSLLLEKKREDLRGAIVWRQYLQRRFLRIYPLYTVVLLVNLLAASGGVGFAFPMTLDGVFNHLALRDGMSVFWTIPVECHFYILLPVIVLVGTALPQRTATFPLTVTLLLGLIAGASTLLPSDSRATLWRNLPAFLGGVFAAWIHAWLDTTLGYANSRAGTVVEGAGWLALGVVLLHIPGLWNWINGTHVAFDHFHDLPGRFAALWTVFLVAVVHGKGALRRILCWEPLRLLGMISFSVYLVHVPVLKMAGRLFPDSPTLAAWATIAGALGLATLTYRTIEKPFVAMGRSPRST